MPEQLKLCTNCAHALELDFLPLCCGLTGYKSLVDGSTLYRFCSDERGPFGDCGPTAANFKAKQGGE